MPTPIQTKTIPPGQPWSGIIEKGLRLRITDLEGRQGVDFLCYNADRTEERYHAPNTLKACRTLALTKGHVLFSDEARAMFTIVADTCGGHDTIGGCCSASSNAMLYGVQACPGCRENFIEALSHYGMDRRDLVPNINFFCNVPVADDMGLADTVFVESRSKAGDFVELRAEMRALAVISNCPQVNNPCNDGHPSPIRVEILN